MGQDPNVAFLLQNKMTGMLTTNQDKLIDTTYSGARTTAQHTGLQLETMSQALFRGLL